MKEPYCACIRKIKSRKNRNQNNKNQNQNQFYWHISSGKRVRVIKVYNSKNDSPFKKFLADFFILSKRTYKVNI